MPRPDLTTARSEPWRTAAALYALALLLGACAWIDPETATPTVHGPEPTFTPGLTSCAPGGCLTATAVRPTTAPVVAATAALAPSAEPPACLYSTLAWPITNPGASIDGTYRFGSTQDGQREPHHGVEIPSPAGTPIVAPAAGRVEFAGEDRQEQLGPYTGFYGNVVVLALDGLPGEEPVFLLFGHLSRIDVRAGQLVHAGDALGLVGSSGVAIGAHLHFEVRVGPNRYNAVRNPELWLAPRLADGGEAGVLAGRVVDRSGAPAHGQQVTVRRVDVGTNGPRTYFLDTYDFEADTSGSDTLLRENFVLSGLPPGQYDVTAFSPSLRQRRVQVVAGAITWVAFDAGETPPSCTQ